MEYFTGILVQTISLRQGRQGLFPSFVLERYGSWVRTVNLRRLLPDPGQMLTTSTINMLLKFVIELPNVHRLIIADEIGAILFNPPNFRELLPPRHEKQQYWDDVLATLGEVARRIDELQLSGTSWTPPLAASAIGLFGNLVSLDVSVRSPTQDLLRPILPPILLQSTLQHLSLNLSLRAAPPLEPHSDSDLDCWDDFNSTSFPYLTSLEFRCIYHSNSDIISWTPQVTPWHLLENLAPKLNHLSFSLNSYPAVPAGTRISFPLLQTLKVYDISYVEHVPIEEHSKQDDDLVECFSKHCSFPLVHTLSVDYVDLEWEAKSERGCKRLVESFPSLHALQLHSDDSVFKIGVDTLSSNATNILLRLCANLDGRDIFLDPWSPFLFNWCRKPLGGFNLEPNGGCESDDSGSEAEECRLDVTVWRHLDSLADYLEGRVRLLRRWNDVGGVERLIGGTELFSSLPGSRTEELGEDLESRVERLRGLIVGLKQGGKPEGARPLLPVLWSLHEAMERDME